MAVETEPDKCLIKGATGLREWSAPETRKSIHSDFRIDCWTLGCLMYFLSTGKHPFKHDDSLTKEFDFKQELLAYSECSDFADMLDLLSSLLVASPDQRLTS